MGNQIIVRKYIEADADQVRKLFIKVNRLLAPADLKDAFESYIVLSLREEIDRIFEYYRERRGSFWVAAIDTKVVGMFGLEQSGPGAMELRRMYVDPIGVVAGSRGRCCNLQRINVAPITCVNLI